MALQLSAEYQQNLDMIWRVLEEEKPTDANVREMVICYWDSFISLNNPSLMTQGRKDFPVGYAISRIVPETSRIKRFFGRKNKEAVAVSVCFDINDGKDCYLVVHPSGEATWSKEITTKRHPLYVVGENTTLEEKVTARLKNSGLEVASKSEKG